MNACAVRTYNWHMKTRDCVQNLILRQVSPSCSWAMKTTSMRRDKGFAFGNTGIRLKRYLASGTRRYDVVKDILEANDYRHISEKKSAEVKQLFNNYKGMTSKVRRGLEELGFEIQHDGGHYKAIYYGDERYILVFAATPSDNRAGKNKRFGDYQKSCLIPMFWIRNGQFWRLKGGGFVIIGYSMV